MVYTEMERVVQSMKLAFFLLMALSSAFSSQVLAVKNSCLDNDDYRDFEIVWDS